VFQGARPLVQVIVDQPQRQVCLAGQRQDIPAGVHAQVERLLAQGQRLAPMASQAFQLGEAAQRADCADGMARLETQARLLPHGLGRGSDITQDRLRRGQVGERRAPQAMRISTLQQG